MTNLRQMLFQKYATEGRDRLVAELKQAHEPKKGDRFHITGITYEIGQIILVEDGIEFEISSKIPLEQLPDGEEASNFFEAVKKICFDSAKLPEYAGMDDIEHKVGEREVKRRDYVRLRYKYNFGELYNEQETQQEAEAIIRGESPRELPQIPGVVSIAGKLVLLAIRESTYQHANQRMNHLIEANEQVSRELGTS